MSASNTARGASVDKACSRCAPSIVAHSSAANSVSHNATPAPSATTPSSSLLCGV